MCAVVPRSLCARPLQNQGCAVLSPALVVHCAWTCTLPTSSLSGTYIHNIPTPLNTPPYASQFPPLPLHMPHEYCYQCPTTTNANAHLLFQYSTPAPVNGLPHLYIFFVLGVSISVHFLN